MKQPVESVFDHAENQRLLARLARLQPESAAHWGKMQVGQMLAHCRQPLLVATGELPLKRGLIGILFGKLAKRKLLAPEPFGRGMPTAPAFRMRTPREFASEHAQLCSLLARFGERGPAVLSTQPHPFFGPLTATEWDRLQWKHLDHHLRQFGV